MLKDYENFKTQFTKNILDIDFNKHYTWEKQILSENKATLLCTSQLAILSYFYLTKRTRANPKITIPLNLILPTIINYSTFYLHSWSDRPDSQIAKLSKSILSEGFLIRKDYILCLCMSIMLYPIKLHLEANKFRYNR